MKKIITAVAFAFVVSSSAFAATTYTCTPSKTNLDGLDNYNGPAVYTFLIDGSHVTGTMSNHSGPVEGVAKFDNLQNEKMDFVLSGVDLNKAVKKMDPSYDSWDHYNYSFSFNSTGGTVDISTQLDCCEPTDDSYALTCSATQD